MKLVKFKLASKGDPGSQYVARTKPRMITSEMFEIHPGNEQELRSAFLAFEKFINK